MVVSDRAAGGQVAFFSFGYPYSCASGAWYQFYAAGANVGGIKYSVVDGITGLLVPPRDPAALAKKIEQLVLDPPLMALMKKNAVAHVQKYFTWTMVACSISHVYDMAIASRAKKPSRKPKFLLEHFDILKRAGEILQPPAYAGLQVNL